MPNLVTRQLISTKYAGHKLQTNHASMPHYSVNTRRTTMRHAPNEIRNNPESHFIKYLPNLAFAVDAQQTPEMLVPST